MKNQSGNVLVILVVLIVIVVAIVMLVSKGFISNPVSKLTSKDPTVTLQTKYDNPFDDSSQYVNPFNSYKNPLDNLK